MISKKVVRTFLKRKLDSFDWIKKVSEKDLDLAISELKVKPKFSGKPWLHQKAVFILMEELKRFMIFLDMGLGKTYLTLLMFSYYRQCDLKPRAMVFVPYVVAVDTWVEQTQQHYPHLKCVPLLGTGEENLAEIQENKDADFFVACYMTMVTNICDKKTVKGKNKLKLDHNKVRKLFGDFTHLIMDECHKCKNIHSLTYRLCNSISNHTKYAFGLTGTPFGGDVTDLWGQFKIIDKGATLGDTLGLFREAFFIEKENYWSGWPEYKFDKKKSKLLHKVIKNGSIRYEIEECMDMPSKIYSEITIKFNESMSKYYLAAKKKMRKLAAAKKKDYHAIDSIFTQQRQMSSGFLTFKGEDNDRVKIQFDENPKLDALIELIGDMPTGRKMVVFHEYRYTNKIICEELKKNKIKYATIMGGAGKKGLLQLKKFRDDPKCIILVINNRLGSSSLNMQHANYVAIYESPTSPIDREQLERRVWRPGQKRKVWFYDFVMKGTNDRRVLNFIKQGHDLFKRIMTGEVDAIAKERIML